ncbi:MAG: rhodanese-like domain-containing protein [Lutimonas sp.]
MMRNFKTTTKGHLKLVEYGFILTLLFSVMLSSNLKAQESKTELPKEKQTVLQKYVTSKEAYDMWVANPENVKILDVRTLDEYIYIGHGEMAYNIPAFLQTQEWDANKHHFAMKPNTEFLKQVKDVFKPEDTILVTCRSGGRSAAAINQLATIGFKNLYNITDGFEGDTVNDPESVFVGKRMVNGWKNSGLPFTYSIDSTRVILLKEN